MLTPPFPHPQIYFLIRLSLQHRITYSTIQYSKLRRVLAPVPHLVPASCNLSRNLFGKCTMISEKSEFRTLLPRVQEGTGPISDSGRYRGNDCEDDDEQEMTTTLQGTALLCTARFATRFRRRGFAGGLFFLSR